MKKVNEKKGGSALAAASLGRNATARVRRHSASDAGLASTGTNVSYEGATAPGGGGSVGTGYASGQSATGEKTSTGDLNENRVGTPAKAKKAAKPKEEKPKEIKKK